MLRRRRDRALLLPTGLHVLMSVVFVLSAMSSNRTYRVEFTDTTGTVLPRLFVPPTRDALDGDIARMELLLTAEATKVEDVTDSTDPEITEARERASLWRTLESRMTFLAS